MLTLHSSQKMILGLERGVLKFLLYNPDWKRLFDEENKVLQSAVGNDVLDI